MKKFCFVLCLLIHFAKNGGAQSNYVDSLLKVIPSQPDSSKVKTLYNVCAFYQDTDADSTLKYCDILYALATNMKSLRWQANAINEKGYVGVVFHDYPKAILHLKEAARLYEAAHIPKGMANAYNNLGLCYSDIGDFPESIHYNELALRLFNETGQLTGKGNSFNNIALIYIRQHIHDKALVYLDSSIACLKQTGDELKLGNPIMNQALVHSNMNHYSMAIELYTKAINIFKKYNDLHRIADIYNNIGNIYTNLKETEKARSYLYKSIAIKKELEDTIGLASSYLNLSTNCCVVNKPDAMRLFLDTAARYMRRMPMAEIAVYYHEELFKYYILKGMSDSALAGFDKYKEVKDSLIQSDITRQLSDMSVKYDTEQIKKEAEQQEKEADKERKIKNVFIIFSVFVLLLLIVLFMVLRKVKAFNTVIKRQREDLIRSNQEITQQKDIIEEKQREILDSIHYARRIQRSLIPTDKYIDRMLSDLKK